jgi:hypothetical protein
MIDFSLIGKQVELLKAISPGGRVGLMFNPEAFPHYEVYLRAFQAEHRPVEVTRVAVATAPAPYRSIAAVRLRR